MMKTILDTDIGGDIDDVLALAFALNSPEIELLAVTTVNTDPGMRARIAAKMLRTFGRQHVPVAAGAKEQFDGAPTFCKDINQAVALTLEDPVPANGHAVDLIVDTASSATDRLTIIGIGCWTNIALAFQAAPDLADAVSRLVLMGGKISPPGPESNITCDPAAAAFVLDLPVPKLLVPLDVTRECRYPASKHKDLAAAGTEQTKLVLDLIRAWQIGRHEGNRRAEPILHDPLAVAVAFDPSLIRCEEELRVTVEFGNTNNPPMTVPAAGTPNAAVVMEVDRTRFEELFARRILSPDDVNGAGLRAHGMPPKLSGIRA